MCKKALYTHKCLMDYDINRQLHGLKDIGFKLIEIDSEKELPTLDEETIYISGYKQTSRVLDQYGIHLADWEDFPAEKKEYFNRKILSSSWDKLLKRKTPGKKFIKPKLKGTFVPFITDFPVLGSRGIDLMAYLHVSENATIWMQDVLEINSEWRIFVHDNEIVDIRRYSGPYWDAYIGDDIFNWVKLNNPPMPSYCVDIGIGYGRKPFIIEYNPGLCFGSYGLDSKTYGEMIALNWKTLFRNLKV